METKTTIIDTMKTWSGLDAPNYWHVVEREADGLKWRRLTGSPLQVIESIQVESDGRRWLHVSVSCAPKRQLPTYEELKLVRKLFIGEHRECYQVFPTSDRYVNFGPVLHLFCCLEQPDGVLPKFEGMVEIDGKKQLSV